MRSQYTGRISNLELTAKFKASQYFFSLLSMMTADHPMIKFLTFQPTVALESSVNNLFEICQVEDQEKVFFFGTKF